MSERMIYGRARTGDDDLHHAYEDALAVDSDCFAPAGRCKVTSYACVVSGTDVCV